MERCGLAALVSAGGPVRVAVRPCCLVALVGRGSSADPPAEIEEDMFVWAAAEAEAAALGVSS